MDNEKKHEDKYNQKILFYAMGIVIMPMGTVLTINAHLGAGGCDAFNFALSELLGISTSLAICITSFIVTLITAIIRKGMPRFSTFISAFLLGLSTDFWKLKLGFIQGAGIYESVLIMCVGLLLIAFAVACYMFSKFPTNPTDDFVVALTEKKWTIHKAKIFLDVVFVVLAFLMGGEIGIGTILCTFGLGPLIELFYRGLESWLKIKAKNDNK